MTFVVAHWCENGEKIIKKECVCFKHRIIFYRNILTYSAYVRAMSPNFNVIVPVQLSKDFSQSPSLLLTFCFFLCVCVYVCVCVCVRKSVVIFQF